MFVILGVSGWSMMRRNRMINYLVLPLTLFLMLVASARCPAEEVVKVGGTGISVGSMKALAKAFEMSNPEIKVIVPPSMGSTGAIRAVSKKAIDIGILARPLNDNETGFGLNALYFARTPMVVIANRDVAVKNISTTDLAAIYGGKKTRWPDGKLIRVPVRPAGETSVLILRKLAPEMDQAMDIAARRKLFTAYSDQDNADFVEKNSGAVSVSSLSLIVSEKRNIKILRLNEVNPTPGNLADGSYPLYYSLYIVSNRDVSAGARKFLDFIQSPRGKKLLRQNGFMLL
jgi:phosphate transport system substrate-binding protein